MQKSKLEKLILIEFDLLVLCCFNVCRNSQQVTRSMSWFHFVWSVSKALNFKKFSQKNVRFIWWRVNEIKVLKIYLFAIFVLFTTKGTLLVLTSKSLPISIWCLEQFCIGSYQISWVHTKLLRPNLVAVLESIFIRTIVKFCSMSK